MPESVQKVINQIKDLFAKLDSTKRLFWVLFHDCSRQSSFSPHSHSIKMLSYFLKTSSKRLWRNY